MTADLVSQHTVLFVFLWCGIINNKNLGETEMAVKKVSKKVLTVEDKQLHNYELMLIISPEVMDEELDTTIDKISQFITEKGGMVSNVGIVRTERLIFSIRRFTEGNYVLTQFKLKPALGKELETKLRISEEILRHLLIRIE